MVVLSAPFSQVSGAPVAVSGWRTQSITGGSGLRNRRLPDGRLEPAGFACLTSNQANVSPGITLAQVFAAVRSVKLPGGDIHVAPASRGLANLRSFFWLEGASQAPVDLSLNGFELHAE